MTSNISFFSMVKNDLKRRIWAMALLFLGLFAALPLAGMMYTESLQNQLANRMLSWEKMIAELAEFVGPVNYGMFAVVVGASVLAAFTGFSFLQSSRKLDLFHSIPVTRKRLFFVQYVSGILVFVIPYALSLVLLLVVCIVKTVCTAAVLVSLVIGAAMHVLYFLLLYHLALIAILLTGRILVSFLGLGVFYGYAFLVWQVALGYFQEFFQTFYPGNQELAGKITQMFSPAFLYLSHIQAFEGKGLQSAAVFGEHWKYLLVLLAEILLFLAVSFWLYQKRRSEAAGHSMAFERCKPVVKVLLLTALSGAGGLIFSSLSEGRKTAWMVFGILFCALVFHCVIEVIYSYEFRQVLSHRLTLVIPLGITLALALAFRFDWFGYDTFLPSVDRLEGISVYLNGLEKGRYLDGADQNGMNNMEYALQTGEMTKDLQPGYELAAAGVQNEKEGRKNSSETQSSSVWNEGDITVDAIVAYDMRNGGRKIRTYQLTAEQVEQLLPDLYEVEGFKEGHNTILGVDVDTLQFDYVEMYDAYHSGRINLAPEDARQLLQAYQKELAAASYEDLKPEQIAGELSFYRNSDGLSVDIIVYESFQETMQLLEKLGYPMRKTPDEKDTVQIDIYSYEEELYDNMDGEYDAPTVTFEGKKDMGEILKAAISDKAAYFEIDQDYMATVTINEQGGQQSNYIQSTYYFKKGEIPECVTKAFREWKENQH